MKGFAITINGIRNWVAFKEFNNKVVICYLEDEFGDVFEGKAFCNHAEGDIFDRKAGEQLALHRAARLRYDRDAAMARKSYKDTIRQISDDYDGLIAKWHTEYNKHKRKEGKSAV